MTKAQYQRSAPRVTRCSNHLRSFFIQMPKHKVQEDGHFHPSKWTSNPVDAAVEEDTETEVSSPSSSFSKKWASCYVSRTGSQL